MGLPRSSEPFQRIQSSPEPPSPARRPRLLGLLVALVSFAVAAGVVFWMTSSDELPAASPPRPSVTAPPASPTDEPEPSEPPSETPSPSPTPTAETEPVTRLPETCATIRQATVQNLVPSAKRDQSSNPILGTCSYTAQKAPFRWLWVEARLYSPNDHPAPFDAASRYYRAQQEQADDNPQAETLKLESREGLGDEAYWQFKVDKGQPTAVGEVTARIRNVVITVSYSERAPGKGEAAERERSCLAKATQVAREVLGEFR